MKLHEVIAEIRLNAENVMKGGLSWWTLQDFARAVLMTLPPAPASPPAPAAPTAVTGARGSKHLNSLRGPTRKPEYRVPPAAPTEEQRPASDAKAPKGEAKHIVCGDCGGPMLD